jgi:ABC-type multidrug transport system ATPase subunit
MTVSSYLNFVARICNVEDRKEQMANITYACDIAPYAGTLIGKLSKGYR